MYTDEPALSPVGFSSLTSATVRAMHRDTGDTMPVTSSPNLSNTLSTMNCDCCSGVCEVCYKPLAKPKVMQANGTHVLSIFRSTQLTTKDCQSSASIMMHKDAAVLISNCGGQHLLANMYDAQLITLRFHEFTSTMSIHKMLNTIELINLQNSFIMHSVSSCFNARQTLHEVWAPGAQLLTCFRPGRSAGHTGCG